MDKGIFMKRIAYAVGGAILVGYFGVYVYNALDDYGLRTNSLNEMVAAQYDKTSTTSSGSGSNGCDGHDKLCEMYLDEHTETIKATTNENGEMNVLGVKLYNYKKNRTYEISVRHRKCVPYKDTPNYCVASEQGYYYISVKGETTSGNDGTDCPYGDSTNRYI